MKTLVLLLAAMATENDKSIKIYSDEPLTERQVVKYVRKSGCAAVSAERSGDMSGEYWLVRYNGKCDKVIYYYGKRK